MHICCNVAVMPQPHLVARQKRLARVPDAFFKALFSDSGASWRIPSAARRRSSGRPLSNCPRRHTDADEVLLTWLFLCAGAAEHGGRGRGGSAGVGSEAAAARIDRADAGRRGTGRRRGRPPDGSIDPRRPPKICVARRRRRSPPGCTAAPLLWTLCA